MPNTLGRSHRALLRQCLLLAPVLCVMACGGGGGESDPPPATAHKVKGSITGLLGSGFILEMNHGNDLAVPANATSFEFTTLIGHGEKYDVKVRANPTGQTCGVTNPTGTAQADVTNIVVGCGNIRTQKVLAGAGPNGSISPKGSVTVNYQSNIEFVATPDPGYVVDRWIVQGGTFMTSATKQRLWNVTEDMGINVFFRPALLTASVSVLRLSVNDVATNAALTGTPRTVVITNSSLTTTATNVSVSAPKLPAGTTLSSSTCGPTLVPGATCSITVTPGSVASSAPDATGTPVLCTTGWAALPDALTVSANEGPPVSVGVIVLGYGCAYQGGFVFAIDDTTPPTSSIGGKVASYEDQKGNVSSGDRAIWSSDGYGSTSDHVDYQLVGVARDSVSPCVGADDGACNTATILAHYSAASYRRELFAAGLCERMNTTTNQAGVLGWYLPAHCEANNCAAGRQSMQTNLVDYKNLNLLSGLYWTSTEAAGSATTQAHGAMFAPGASPAAPSNKNELAQVRCVRALSD
jgi:hypothetical protein